MDKKKLEALRTQLNEFHKWPSMYMFKFILPNNEQSIKSLKAIFGETSSFSSRLSKNGKYTSVTVKEIMLSADKVFERYTEAAKIEGIISL